MKASEIDDEGNWHNGTEVIPLVGEVIPIPSFVTHKTDASEEAEILMLLQTKAYFEICPSCEQKLPDSQIVLATEHLFVMPVKCCDTIIWLQSQWGDIDREQYA